MSLCEYHLNLQRRSADASGMLTTALLLHVDCLLRIKCIFRYTPNKCGKQMLQMQIVADSMAARQYSKFYK